VTGLEPAVPAALMFHQCYWSGQADAMQAAAFGAGARRKVSMPNAAASQCAIRLGSAAAAETGAHWRRPGRSRCGFRRRRGSRHRSGLCRRRFALRRSLLRRSLLCRFLRSCSFGFHCFLLLARRSGLPFRCLLFCLLRHDGPPDPCCQNRFLSAHGPERPCATSFSQTNLSPLPWTGASRQTADTPGAWADTSPRWPNRSTRPCGRLEAACPLRSA
jgi:hypothetical protein